MTDREQRLAQTFVEMADTLVSEFDVAEFLYRLVDRCTELFEADESGLVMTDSAACFTLWPPRAMPPT